MIRRSRTLRHLWALVPLLIGWAFRIIALQTQSLWYDEGYSAMMAGLPLAEIAYRAAQDFTPPGYYVLLKAWTAWAGYSEFSLRFLSAMIGLLIVAGTYRLGHCLFARREAGWLAAALLAVAPFAIWHGRNARPYALQTLGIALGTLCLVQAIKAPTPRRRRWAWAGLALADTVALYAHTTAVIGVAFHTALLAVVACRNRRLRWPALLTLIAVGLAWAPWVLYAYPGLATARLTAWAGSVSWATTVTEGWTGLVTGDLLGTSFATVAAGLWAISTACAVLVATVTSPSNAQRRGLGITVLYLCLPLALLAALLQFGDAGKFKPRYLTSISPAIYLLVGGGIALVSRKRLVHAGLIGMLMMPLTPALHRIYDPVPPYAKSDFRAAAAYIQAHGNADDLIILQPGAIYPAWAYYAPESDWIAVPDDPLINVEHILHYENTAPLLNEALAGRSGAWVIRWEGWVNDPTRIVPFLLAQAGAQQPTPAFADLNVQHYTLEMRLPLPESPNPPRQLALETVLPLHVDGCYLAPASESGATVAADCFWRAQAAVSPTLGVSARVVDADDVEWAREDGAVSSLAPDRWPAAQTAVRGAYEVALPYVAPGNGYRLELVLYDWQTAYEVGRLTMPFAVTAPAIAPTTTIAIGRQIGDVLVGPVTVAPINALPGSTVILSARAMALSPTPNPVTLTVGQDRVPLAPTGSRIETWPVDTPFELRRPLTLSRYTTGGTLAIRAASGQTRHTVGTLRLGLERTFELPTDVEPFATPYAVSETIRLRAAHMTREDNSVRVQLYWQAEARMDQDYTVFAQLNGPAGFQVTADGTPTTAGQPHPTTHWEAGEVIVDERVFPLDGSLPAGDYQVVVGMYTWPELERLPVTQGAASVADNAVVVGRLAVGADEARGSVRRRE
jgi:hypothetical protein